MKMKLWPALAPLGVLLIEARGFVVTPSLSHASQRHPTQNTVEYVHDLTPDILIGVGVTFLGLASVVVFVAALADFAWRRTSKRVPALVMLLGAAISAAAVFVGFAVFVALAAASEESGPGTVAAVYIISDSLGYIGWTAWGLVSGAVAVVSIRDHVLPRWIGWFSVVTTALFAVCAFFPFLSWAPAIAWISVVGVGLLVHRVDADAAPA